jgi:hypothetical protein
MTSSKFCVKPIIIIFIISRCSFAQMLTISEVKYKRKCKECVRKCFHATHTVYSFKTCPFYGLDLFPV